MVALQNCAFTSRQSVRYVNNPVKYVIHFETYTLTKVEI